MDDRVGQRLWPLTGPVGGLAFLWDDEMRDLDDALEQIQHTMRMIEGKLREIAADGRGFRMIFSFEIDVFLTDPTTAEVGEFTILPFDCRQTRQSMSYRRMCRRREWFFSVSRAVCGNVSSDETLRPFHI